MHILPPTIQVPYRRVPTLVFLSCGLFIFLASSISYLLDLYGFNGIGFDFGGVAFEKRDLGLIKSRQGDEVAGPGESWIVLPVSYKYDALKDLDNNLFTQVFIGEGNDRQQLKLAITLQQITWVPQLPASRTEFCNNRTNESGCKIAGVSGYYDPPSNVTTDERFGISYGENITAQGYWSNSTLTATTTTISLSFGVATYWRSLAPSLGLGVHPFNRSPGHTSYLLALQQQGKIASQYVSCYDVSNSRSIAGEIVFGGVDKDKFRGKMKVWRGGDYPGIVETPRAMVATGGNTSFATGEVADKALITPDTRFLWLPQPVLYKIIEILPVATYDLNSDKGFPVYTVPCKSVFNPSWVIQFAFDNDMVISVPFNNLVTPIEVSTGTSNSNSTRCVLAVLPNDGRYKGIEGYEFSYILGTPFWRSAYVVFNPQENLTALALSNPEVLTHSIVELRGSSGTQLEEIEGNNPSSFRPPPPNTTTPPDSPSMKKTLGVGAIAGASVSGALIAVGLLWLGIVLMRRRRRKRIRMASPQYSDRVELDGVDIGNSDWRGAEGVKKRRREENEEETPLGVGRRPAELPTEREPSELPNY